MKKTTVLISAIFFVIIHCKAQFVFDLSNFLASTESISLNTKKEIVIKNMALQAGYTYSYKVDVKDEPVPPFSTVGLAGAGCASIVGDANNAAYLIAESNLLNEADERQIESLVKKLEETIKKLDAATNQACIDKGNELIKKTRLDNQQLTFDLKENQTITIIVTRTSNVAGSKPITWTKIYKTPTKTPWLIHYGLTYRPNIISRPDLFFSKSIPNTMDSFTVTKQNGNPTKFWENVSPTIMFSYPFTKKERDIKFGFTGIVSSNFSSFSGGAGLSAIIGYNVAIGTGVMFTQKNFLKGEYKVGDIIRSSLTFDQLHQKQWMPEFFFTIGFRFDKNPFSGNETPKPATSPSN